MPYARLIEPGKRIRLSDEDPSRTDGHTKETARAEMAKLSAEIDELQELLVAAGETALLCIFQGMDTAGKDGAINRVLSYVNVQSCHVAAFKVPSPTELAHDFLWRVHGETPPKGGITLFNRSHYEDVLVVRVHNLVPPEVWKKRYAQINAFEEVLEAGGTTILKFFLHISKQEQEERLLARERDPLKAWKLAVGDWKERKRWDEYVEAYEDVLHKCGTEEAPWHIVPANKKWFRDLAIAEAIRDAIAPHRKTWMDTLDKMGARATEELRRFRSSEAT